MADTIAAICTGGEASAIGVIRLSGGDAIRIADRVFRAKNNRSLLDAENRKLYYGELRNKNGETIDLCLCTVSRAPYSYTGEHTAELHCHGSPVVLAEGLRALFFAGARQAEAGEFTKRAFLNGRMDLSQAEAVVDLIDAETVPAAQNAAGQLAGAVRRKAEAIYEDLVGIMAHFHAVIDYPDEDIDDFRLADYLKTLRNAEKTLSRLADTFDRGRLLKEGVRSVIIGRPNTGKSSLLNILVGYERAIVTEIPGTTRDTIEETVHLGGTLLRLTDTAGIRKTEDSVEKLGVARSAEAAEGADLVLAVFEGSEELADEDINVLIIAEKAPKCIAVVNKSDLPQKIDMETIKRRIHDVCVISAKDGTGVERIGEAVRGLFGKACAAPAGELLTNARQAGAVERARKSVEESVRSLETGITPDAVLTDVEAALSALGEITGKTVRDDVTASIFERFCVGK